MHDYTQHPAMVYERDGIRFTWWGGEYIELGPEGTDEAVDVINVWNHALDKPNIERTLDGFRERCDEYAEAVVPS